MGSSLSTPFSTSEEPVQEKSSRRDVRQDTGIDKLPVELVLEILSHLDTIDLFPVKLGGSHYVASVVQTHFTSLSLPEYVRVVEDEVRRRVPDNGPYTAIGLAAARGHLGLATALLENASDSFQPRGIGMATLCKTRNGGSGRMQIPFGQIERGHLLFVVNGRNALHWAAEFGQDKMIELFLEYGAEILTPLHLARRGDILGAGSTVGSALHLAAANGHESTVRLLMREGAPVNSCDCRGDALAWAAKRGQVRMVALLIKEGAEATIEALTEAARYGHMAVVSILLAFGAQSGKDGLSRNPLAEALMHGHLSTAKLLLEAGSAPQFHPSVLSLTAAKGHEDCVRLLMELNAPHVTRGMDLPAPGPFPSQMCPPLHSAAARHQLSTVSLLLQHGCDPEEMIAGDGTALHFAASVDPPRDEAVAELLVQAGAGVDTRDPRGNSPLHLAAQRGNYKLGAYLISEGAEPDAGNSWGSTPLHCAAANGQIDVINLLVDRGCDVNVRGPEGDTPLHHAAMAGEDETLALLRNRGAAAIKNRPYCFPKASIATKVRGLPNYLSPQGMCSARPSSPPSSAIPYPFSGTVKF